MYKSQQPMLSKHILVSYLERIFLPFIWWDERVALFFLLFDQMINRERSMDEDLFSEGKMVQFQYTGQSSDDSDSFDDEDDGGEESDME